ncbi:MAG: alpha-N-arabinofuranosidase, partial [Clostridia bacterium]|nr:alpha-N-arabinofuranosidase [Clostridia bacterium]
DYSTVFDATGYFDVVLDALDMENLVTKHSTIMDKYDPGKRVALFVDEWGTWYKVEEGTNPGFLYQQNTMRDAVVAASLLNIFNNHSDRVRMTNIAQTVNVLQSVILTEGDKMVKTPTYHIYDLYTPHHDATLIGCDVLENEKYTVEKLPAKNDRRMPDVLDAVNISATKAEDGSVTATVCNIAHDKAVECELDLVGNSYTEATARILTSPKFDDMNTFDNPDNVVIENVNVELSGGKVKFTLPAFSTIAVTVK